MMYQPEAFCCTTMFGFPFDRVVFHFSGLYYNLLCVFLILVCYFFTARRPPNGLLPWQKTRRYQLPWITSWWWRVIQDRCTHTRPACIMNVECEMVKRNIFTLRDGGLRQGLPSTASLPPGDVVALKMLLQCFACRLCYSVHDL
jgi:hypothetical protein